MPTALTISVLDDYQQVAAVRADWSRLGSGVEIRFVHEHLDEHAVAQELETTEVVCLMRERTPFPATLFARLPQLRLIVTTGMRNASIDLEAARRHGVTVCGTESEQHGTAELTWGLVLAAARHLTVEDAGLRRGAWQQRVGMLLRGRTLGILGLGRLGSTVAGYGNAFGMDVLAWSQNLTPESATARGATWVPKEELFRRSDVLTIHLKLSERTSGLVGAAELALMPAHAILVNTSRGQIVDEAALIAALHAGGLGCAALDVYPKEPLDGTEAIARAPNTILTPHIGFVTDRSYALCYEQTVDAIEAWRAGTPIRVLP